MQFVTIKAAPMMSTLCKANVVVSNVSSCDKTNIHKWCYYIELQGTQAELIVHY